MKTLLAALFVGTMMAIAYGSFFRDVVFSAPEECYPQNTKPVCAALHGDSATWYTSGRSCATLTVRSFNADGSKRQSYRIRDASHRHRVDGCVRDEVGWWGGLGYEVPDKGGAYYVLRAVIWKAPRAYVVYASSDGEHSGARAWTGGRGNFERVCMDPTVALFAGAC
jgi:hypothetical protein